MISPPAVIAPLTSIKLAVATEIGPAMSVIPEKVVVPELVTSRPVNWVILSRETVPVPAVKIRVWSPSIELLKVM